jgi:hypothetical protein
MQAITTVGLDIAKSVFQVHGVDAAGKMLIRRQLKRRQVLPFFERLPACVVGMEACATSHHWSRQLRTLGHTVRLMPPAYVKPYVKRQKNDAADAEAICEAVTRANMRFVETKTPEQQACLMLHRTCHLFIRQQTSVINAIRAHMAEFGIVARVGRTGVAELLAVAGDPRDRRLPEVARTCVAALHFDRARYGLRGNVELDEQAIAGLADYAPTIRLNSRLEVVAAQQFEARQSAALVGCHEPRVPDHVGCEDRGKAALSTFFGHVYRLSNLSTELYCRPVPESIALRFQKLTRHDWDG